MPNKNKLPVSKKNIFPPYSYGITPYGADKDLRYFWEMVKKNKELLIRICRDIIELNNRLKAEISNQDNLNNIKKANRFYKNEKKITDVLLPYLKKQLEIMHKLEESDPKLLDKLIRNIRSLEELKKLLHSMKQDERFRRYKETIRKARLFLDSFLGELNILVKVLKKPKDKRAKAAEGELKKSKSIYWEEGYKIFDLHITPSQIWKMLIDQNDDINSFIIYMDYTLMGIADLLVQFISATYNAYHIGLPSWVSKEYRRFKAFSLKEPIISPSEGKEKEDTFPHYDHPYPWKTKRSRRRKLEFTKRRRESKLEEIFKKRKRKKSREPNRESKKIYARRR
ncbi:hypothetical protein KY358_04730 [Candidatus Woesearchaeota archaeon]|nr:hypothetical protein [Candidatus Woesearchaeota archaeon]